MQSIENLLSPADQSVKHDFAFESQNSMGVVNKKQKSPTLSYSQSAEVNHFRDFKGSGEGIREPPGEGMDVANEYSLDAEMAEYDVDPLPLDAVMNHEASSAKKKVQGGSEKGTRSRRTIIEEKSHWQKKDVVTKGQYKPWFFSRFAKSRIPLGKPQCMADLKVISSSCRNLKMRLDGSDSERNGSQQKNRKYKSEEERMSARRRRDKEEEEEEDDDDEEEEEEELWVECENCKKWRKVPAGVEIDQEKSFFCQMLPSVTCETAEEAWDEEETEWVEDNDTKEANGGGGGKHGTSPHNGDNHTSGSNGRSKGGGGYGEGQGSKKRRAPSGAEIAGGEGEASTPLRARKSRRPSPGSPHSVCSDEPLSPEDITAASSLYGRGGGGGGGGGGSSQGMSRLAAVMRVLRATGRALHYDALTKQALRLGLIRFTGSQGTAGESMKAFLNKTIREHKTAAVVNLGKGVYGLKQWQTGPDPAVSSCSGSGSGGGRGGEAWQSAEPVDGCARRGRAGRGSRRGGEGRGARGRGRGRRGEEGEGGGVGRGGSTQAAAELLAN